MFKGKLFPASADVKFAELSGVVTVGPEHAKILSEKLGREVLPGEKFDLGVIAAYHRNPIKRLYHDFRVALAQRKSLFANPLDEGTTKVKK